MAISMYQASVPALQRTLKALDAILDKAVANAAERVARSGKVERSAHTGDQHRQDQAEEHRHAAIRVADKRGVNPLAFLRSKRPTVGHSACEAQHRSLALSFYPGAIAVA